MRGAVFAFTERGKVTARRVADHLDGEIDLYAPARLAGEGFAPYEGGLPGFVGELFDREALIFVGAAGIALRAVAPYVASKKGKIYCNDELNPVWYFTQPGAAKPGKCTDAGMERNFFIGWNMLANNGRTVGTGAYIVKLKSFVKMGGYGKKAKQEKTSVWGAKRGLPKGADLMGVLNQILH